MKTSLQQQESFVIRVGRSYCVVTGSTQDRKEAQQQQYTFEPSRILVIIDFLQDGRQVFCFGYLCIWRQFPRML